MAHMEPATITAPSSLHQEGDLLSRYREMALDKAREAEAQDWGEGLISEAADQYR